MNVHLRLVARSPQGATDGKAVPMHRLARKLRACTESLPFAAEDERRTLLAAADLLERLASSNRRAEADCGPRSRDAQDDLCKIRAAMMPCFGALSSVADQVALIGVMQLDVLRHAEERIASPAHLRRHFNESMDLLAATLLSKIAPGGHAKAVDDAWQRFLNVRSTIPSRHRALIAMLNQNEPLANHAAPGQEFPCTTPEASGAPTEATLLRRDAQSAMPSMS